MKFTLAHSPDADDAFMFYPLLQGKIDLKGFEFEEIQAEISKLNQKTEEAAYDVSAISFHQYPYVQENYQILPTGACFGENYGPVVVSNRPLKSRQALKLLGAIPGKRTTAFLVLKLWERAVAGEGHSGISYIEVPFDQVLDRVADKKADLGLVIHEGQMTYAERGLIKIVDLGEWWHKETRLPLPLGCLVVRRGLDWETKKGIAEVIESSIRYALEHKDETVQAVLSYARGLDAGKAGEFIGRYVNDLTINFGRKGLRAIRALYEKGYDQRILAAVVDLDEAILDLKRPEVKVEEPVPTTPPPEASSVDEPAPTVETSEETPEVTAEVTPKTQDES